MTIASRIRSAFLLLGLCSISAIFADPAFAVEAPTISNVTAEASLNAGTLTGTIDPHNSGTHYYVRYGQTTSYGNHTEFRWIGNQSANVSEVLSALQPATTYHARLVASNSSGSTESADIAFTTLAWNINGSPVSQPTSYSVRLPTGVLKVQGTKFEKPLEITCQNFSDQGFGSGDLTSEYRFRFTGCETRWNGAVVESCTPIEEEEYLGGETILKFNLDGSLVPEPIQFGEECFLGETLPLDVAGFTIGAMTEAKLQEVTLAEHLWVYGAPMSVTISGQEWGLTAGYSFGIS